MTPHFARVAWYITAFSPESGFGMSTAAVVPLRRVRVVVRGLAITAIAAPPLVFFGILFSHLTGLPVRDDYDAILAFANGLVTTPNKLWYSLACQFN